MVSLERKKEDDSLQPKHTPTQTRQLSNLFCSLCPSPLARHESILSAQPGKINTRRPSRKRTNLFPGEFAFLLFVTLFSFFPGWNCLPPPSCIREHNYGPPPDATHLSPSPCLWVRMMCPRPRPVCVSENHVSRVVALEFCPTKHNLQISISEEKHNQQTAAGNSAAVRAAHRRRHREGQINDLGLDLRQSSQTGAPRSESVGYPTTRKAPAPRGSSDHKIFPLLHIGRRMVTGFIVRVRKRSSCLSFGA